MLMLQYPITGKKNKLIVNMNHLLFVVKLLFFLIFVYTIGVFISFDFDPHNWNPASFIIIGILLCGYILHTFEIFSIEFEQE